MNLIRERERERERKREREKEREKSYRNHIFFKIDIFLLILQTLYNAASTRRKLHQLVKQRGKFSMLPIVSLAPRGDISLMQYGSTES